MAALVLTDADIVIATNNLSDHFMSVSIEPNADTQESTAFGDDWREYEGGLKDFTVSMDFNQDFDANELDATLWPLFGTKVACEVKPTSGGRSTSNPAWVFNAIINSYPIVGTSVGELVTGSLGMQGSGELQRLTS